ncbi:MAG: portal protein [Patescibacteria group bacterium]
MPSNKEAGPKFNQPVFKKLWAMFRRGSMISTEIKPSFDRKEDISSFTYDFGGSHNGMNAYQWYGLADKYGTEGESTRNARYVEYNQMEGVGEIHTALNIVSDECTSRSEDGKLLYINSANDKVRDILSTLFYDIINIDFYGWHWVRALCKYGDKPMYLDVHPQHGIQRVIDIPVDDFIRIDGTPQDFKETIFTWRTRNLTLENWQVAHFRLLGQDKYLPYGTSYLEGARPLWRKLVLMEDAMLVYRVLRAPERRVFYLDVSGMKPEMIDDYVRKAQEKLKKQNVVTTLRGGQLDQRFDPLDVSEDYFIPVRGGETNNKIESLPGGQHVNDIEDVEYLRKKLIAALGIPRAYLTYEEDLANKATLASLDIRFSRTIERIQRSFVNELTKIALVHLIAIGGFSKEDLFSFELGLTNPSNMAAMQKLELMERRVQVASALHDENLFDRQYIYKEFFNVSEDDIGRIQNGRMRDAYNDGKIDFIKNEASGGAPGSEGGGGGGGGFGGGFGGEEGGGESLTTGGGGGEEELGGGSAVEVPEIPEEGGGGGEVGGGEEVVTAANDAFEKAQAKRDRNQKLTYRQNRDRMHNRAKSGLVDITKLVTNDDDDSTNDPYSKGTFSRLIGGYKTESRDLYQTELKKPDKKFCWSNSNRKIFNEISSIFEKFPNRSVITERTQIELDFDHDDMEEDEIEFKIEE